MSNKTNSLNATKKNKQDTTTSKTTKYVKPRKMNTHLFNGKLFETYIDDTLIEIISIINMNDDETKHINDDQQSKLIEYINTLKPKIIKYKTLDKLSTKSQQLSLR